MNKKIMLWRAPVIKSYACFFVLFLVFFSGCGFHAISDRTHFMNKDREKNREIEEKYFFLLGRGDEVKILWGKGVYKTLKELFGNDDRVTEEYGVLCLLAKKLNLPRKPWVGDILVCKSPKKEGKGVGKLRACVVLNVFLEFYNEGNYLRMIKEAPLFAAGLQKNSPISSFLRPYVDPNRKKIFSLCYRLKGWKEVNEKEDLQKLGNKIPIFSERSKWDEAEEIYVGEEWIHKNVLKIIKPPHNIKPKRI